MKILLKYKRRTSKRRDFLLGNLGCDFGYCKQMDSKSMYTNNSAKTELSRRFCPNLTEKYFYCSLSTRHIHTKQRWIPQCELTGLGHSPRAARRGRGGAGAAPAPPLPAETGGDRNAVKQKPTLHPTEHSKPCQRTHQKITLSQSATFTTSCNYLTTLPAQSWPWTAFGFLCTVQEDEFENSSNIYPNVVLKQRKTSSLLKRRFIHKQTSVFNNRPAN